MFKRPLEADDFSIGQSALFSMCLQQGALGSQRGFPGGGKSDGWSNAANAVQVAIGCRDMLDDPALTASHVVGRDDSFSDLAFERGCKAVPYSTQANVNSRIGCGPVDSHRSRIDAASGACSRQCVRQSFE
jgi:hypothetical protein